MSDSNRFLVVAYKPALFDYHEEYHGSHGSDYSLDEDLTREEAINAIADLMTRNALNNHSTTTKRCGNTGLFPYKGADYEIRVFEVARGDSPEDRRTERLASIWETADQRATERTEKAVAERLARIKTRDEALKNEQERDERRALATLKSKYET